MISTVGHRFNIGPYRKMEIFFTETRNFINPKPYMTKKWVVPYKILIFVSIGYPQWLRTSLTYDWPCGENIWKLLISEISKQFDNKVGWNDPWMVLYQMLVFVSISNPKWCKTKVMKKNSLRSFIYLIESKLYMT